MPPTLTPRLSLEKPETGDAYTIAINNSNMDKLDVDLGGATICTAATRPSTTYNGMVIYETDTRSVLVRNAAAWHGIGIHLCTAATRPSSSVSFPGMQIFETDTGNRLIRDGTNANWIVTSIYRVGSAAARDALGSVQDGMVIYRTDRDWLEHRTGGAEWRIWGTAVCVDEADRDAAITTPYTGLVAVTQDTGTTWIRFAAAWHDIKHVGNFADMSKMKWTDKTVISSTTLSDDNELVVPMVINATYAIDGHLIYSSATNADAKFAISGPAGAIAQISGHGIPTTTDTAFGTIDVAPLNIGTDWQIGGGGVGTRRSCSPRGHIATAGTAGSAVVRFAQVTSQASNTVLHSRSWITLRRIG